MRWMTPEVSAAFPVVVAAALIRSGLVRSHTDLEILVEGMNYHRSILHEDHPRLTRDEHNMIALLQAWLLRSLTEFVEDIDPDLLPPG